MTESIRYFDEKSLESEYARCKEEGMEVEELKKYNFNALQLAEIRRGYASKLDVSKYLDPKLSWIEMEEIRIEMLQGIDMEAYRQQGFEVQQLYQIRKGISEGLDVSVYAKKTYLAEQMNEIRLGLKNSPDFPVIFYLDPAFDYLQMKEIRKALEDKLDVSVFAHIKIPYMKMRVARRSARDGLVFNEKLIANYDAGTLEQLHKAFLDKVDISSYVKAGYMAEQLDEIRTCIKEGIQIDPYINVNMRSDCIKEIRLGIESGINVDQYADAVYSWLQMREMRLGLEHQIDISAYRNPYYWPDQMHEIRLGLEDGLDVSSYATFMYTGKDMFRLRHELMAGQKIQMAETLPDEAADDGSPEERRILVTLLARRDKLLSFSEDSMMCWMTLENIKNKDDITYEIVLKFLRRCHIIKGVDKGSVSRMLQDKDTVKKHLVAVGKNPAEGKNGYYEFFFDKTPPNRIKVDPYGKADFDQIDTFTEVKIGDLIAKYHRATSGSDGYDVFGNRLQAKRGKESPILKGEGFMLLNDRVSYVSKHNGSLKFSDGKMIVHQVEYYPYIKSTMGIVHHDGSIIVEGDVYSGSDIDVAGDVIIKGHAEGCYIKSGGDIIIKGGATFPSNYSLRATGNVIGKYFERVKIYARNVFAGSLIKCRIYAEGVVRAVGNEGKVYGGRIESCFGFEAPNVGNKNGTRTVICLGVMTKYLNEFNTIKRDIARSEEELRILTKERDKLREIGAVSGELMQWKIKINAAVASKERILKDQRAKGAEMEATIDKGYKATATITNSLYGGVLFSICGITHKVDYNRVINGKITFHVDNKQERMLIS